MVTHALSAFPESEPLELQASVREKSRWRVMAALARPIKV
jgi:hypothetical protein